LFEIRWQGHGGRNPDPEDEIELEVAVWFRSETQRYPRSTTVRQVARGYDLPIDKNIIFETRRFKKGRSFGDRTLGELFKEGELKWLRIYYEGQDCREFKPEFEELIEKSSSRLASGACLGKIIDSGRPTSDVVFPSGIQSVPGESNQAASDPQPLSEESLNLAPESANSDPQVVQPSGTFSPSGAQSVSGEPSQIFSDPQPLKEESLNSFDKRICPWECYVDEEVRPYFPETMLRFRLKDSGNVPDTTHEFGGVAGGQTPQGYILPPIVFPEPPVNTTSPSDPKVPGSLKGPVGDSDSSSDSWEEEDLADVDLSEDERAQRMMVADAHQLHKLRQAVV
jgi:hypothetical protein